MANSNINMSENLGMSSEPRELKLGPSFCSQGSLYHTIRYDFKPASVDVNKMASVEVNDKNPKEVLVTVPHTDGAGVPHTVFKGNQSPIRRDCVLIIDKITGEITLEKLHTNIIVKKTRPETASKLSIPHPEPLPLSISSRKPSPKHPRGRGNASPKPPSLGCIPKHSPLHASPNPSLPMIGEIDPRYDEPNPATIQHNYKSFTEPPSNSVPEINILPEPKEHHAVVDEQSRPVKKDSEKYKSSHQSNVPSNNGMDDMVGVLSDSSSDSSSDLDSSDSSSETETTQPTSQGRMSGSSIPTAERLLSDDLQLSDSGSDSD